MPDVQSTGDIYDAAGVLIVAGAKMPGAQPGYVVTLDAQGNLSPQAVPVPASVGVLASTGAAGYALINGTGAVLSWTAPSDGQLHYVNWALLQHVTSTETGGAVVTGISGKYTVGNGFAGGSAAGWFAAGTAAVLNPGDTFLINQSTALTAGAAVVFGVIWGL